MSELDAAQLSLLPVAKAPVDRAAGVVRVMTWNVQHAAPARSRRQAAWVTEQTADVMVLTEVGAGESGTALAQALSEHGYTTHTPHVAAAHSRDYQVMLACRGGSMQVLPQPRTEHLPHRCAAVRVRMNDAEIVVVGLYVPSRGPKDRRNVDKRAFQSAVTAVLPPLVEHEVPVVVTGDLNVLEPGHVPAHTNFGDWEYAFYNAFADHGLADGFRHLHPETVAHSWIGRRSGAGYRFDHLFLDTAHLPWLTACDYDTAPLSTGLSDHAALTATVAPPPATPASEPPEPSPPGK